MFVVTRGDTDFIGVQFLKFGPLHSLSPSSIELTLLDCLDAPSRRLHGPKTASRHFSKANGGPQRLAEPKQATERGLETTYVAFAECEGATRWPILVRHERDDAHALQEERPDRHTLCDLLPYRVARARGSRIAESLQSPFVAKNCATKRVNDACFVYLTF